MKKILFLLCINMFLFAKEDFMALNYTSLNDQAQPTNDFFSLYAKGDEKFSFLEGDLDLRVGATIHTVLKKSGNFDFFTTVKNERALLDSLSIDYYLNPKNMISVGRESLDINLLHGNFDGILLSHNNEDFNIKTFYFNHYSILFPSYYINQDIDDLFGFNLNYSKGYFDSEISYFNYNTHEVSNLYLAMFYNSFVVGAEYLSFNSQTLNDEEAYKLHTGYRHNNLYAELGYYEVIEGGLKNIYNLGGTAFNTFLLNAFLNQNEAKNIYADFVYNAKPFYAKLHLGKTDFKNINNDKRKGVEAGLTFSYTYNDMEFLSSYLAQESNLFGVNQYRTEWLQTHLKYRF